MKGSSKDNARLKLAHAKPRASACLVCETDGQKGEGGPTKLLAGFLKSISQKSTTDWGVVSLVGQLSSSRESLSF